MAVMSGPPTSIASRRRSWRDSPDFLNPPHNRSLDIVVDGVLGGLAAARHLERVIAGFDHVQRRRGHERFHQRQKFCRGAEGVSTSLNNQHRLANVAKVGV